MSAELEDTILTATEAAQALRCEEDDAVMLGLLPLVDDYIQGATGRDWTQDATIEPKAKSAARMLLVQWYENPGMIASGYSSLERGLSAALAQLEAEALKYKKVKFWGRNGAGAIVIPEAQKGDTVLKLEGVYGAEGDRSEDFEDQISVARQIQQSASGDLSGYLYVLILKSPADEVGI